MQDDITPTQPNTTPPEDLTPQANAPSTPDAFATPVAGSSVEPNTASIAGDTSPTPFGPVGSGEALNTTPPSQPGSGSKKKVVIGGILAAVLVLLIGGGAAAYKMWYQNPNKVVGDALLSVLDATTGTATGTATVDSKEVSVKVTTDGKSSKDAAGSDTTITFTMKSGELAKKDFTVKAGTVLTKDGVVYVKLSNLEDAANSLLDAYIKTQVKAQIEYQNAIYRTQTGKDMTEAQKKQLEQQVMTQASKAAKEQMNPIVKKFDNQWIKIDLKEFSDEAGKAQKCLTDAYTKLHDDKSVRKEIVTTYEKNQFVVIKDELGAKNGSLGYLVDLNEDKAKQFGKDFKETDFAKDVNKCIKDAGGETDDATDDLTDDSTKSPIKDGRFEIWVDRWSHKLTGIHYEAAVDEAGSQAKMVADYSFKLGASADVEIPKDAKTLDDLKKEFQTLDGGSSMMQTSSPLSLL